MKRVKVAENEPKEHWLTPIQAHLLASSGVVTAAASPHNPGLWTIKALGKVGVAQVGDMEVWITPNCRSPGCCSWQATRMAKNRSTGATRTSSHLTRPRGWFPWSRGSCVTRRNRPFSKDR
jgi:hypothetical protein